jgi:cathepsin L
MKTFVFLAALVVYASAFQFTAEWELWKRTNGRDYATDKEEIHRHTIWEANKQYVDAHNQNADKWGYTLATNQFADLENSEFVALYNGYRQVPRDNTTRYYQAPAGFVAPTSMDWRKDGAVTPVKNQAQCGSCWAFSTTGSIEGQHFLKTKQLVSLSEQQLVDCSEKYGNHGCQGGLMDNAFKYIKANGGIDTEASYSYTAHNGKTCKFSTANIGATLTGFTDIKHGDIDGLLAAATTVGPISVAMDASHMSFQLYHSGVYDPFLCSSTKLDHGVLVVGFGAESGIFSNKDYWLVKNSWGPGWGDQGYFKIVRKGNKCGIATDASYPLV